MSRASLRRARKTWLLARYAQLQPRQRPRVCVSGKLPQEADTAAANDVLSAAAELLIKLRDSRIRLLSELAVSMREVAAQFEQPGEADAARKKLEALLGEAEAPKSIDLSMILKARETAVEGASM